MQKITFDSKGFLFDGERRYLISGEFPYFRVPRSDWKRRMEIFMAAGGNAIATYVPWIVHEPEEGNILFSGEDFRDLPAFLETAREVGLPVALRPGPYQYSELIHGGIPHWLMKNYPEVLAVDVKGERISSRAVSYLHPVFLEKARRYYRAFAETVRPYLGDPVYMIQVDNETTGIHVWSGSMDMHPVTMGFGRMNGRYARFLARTFASVSEMNEAYGTDFASFAEARPRENFNPLNPTKCLQLQDYTDFYHETVAEYLSLLESWLREDGITVTVCHNAANPSMIDRFLPTIQKMEPGFLLGVDHYFNLDQTWPQNGPTPQTAIRDFWSLDRLRLLSMPQTVLEMQAGSPSNYPPMLCEDLLAWYRMNLAFGMKGMNLYVFTGGPNVPGTATTADIYDYSALLHADGTKNVTFPALERFAAFANENPWLLSTRRRASVRVGFLHSHAYGGRYACKWFPMPENEVTEFADRGVLPTLFTTPYVPELCDLEGELSCDLPLIVAVGSVLARSVQEKLIAFVRAGGRLLLCGRLPERDERMRPCTLLADYLGAGEDFAIRDAAFNPPRTAAGHGIYGITRRQIFRNVPAGCETLLTDEDNGGVLAFSKKDGGEAIFAGLSWIFKFFSQSEMLEDFLRHLGAEPILRSKNRTVLCSLREDPATGRKMLFMMNLYSGSQCTEITLCDGGAERPLGSFELAPMEVRSVEIEG